MNYAFLDAIADFDPATFQLPASLQSSQGPPVQAQPVAPQVQRLAQQVQREVSRSQQQDKASPQASSGVSSQVSSGVSHNLQMQLQLSVSEQRTAQLKAQLLRLKGLSVDTAPAERSVALLTALEVLQHSYRAEYAPKDLATMSVLHPLLKCQALKWDQLNAKQTPVVPAPEAAYLQKLRQLKGSLGAVEKAALYQLILTINEEIKARFEPVTPTASQSTDRAPTITEPPLTSPAPSADLAACTGATSPGALASGKGTEAPAPLSTDFDPLKASREIMQLRAKLQRTYSASEKQALQQDLARLTQRQQAYFQQRQAQALNKQCQEFGADLRRFAQPERLTQQVFEQWRKLRLTGLQGLARLYSQPADPLAISCFESAMRQLARLGMADAREHLQRERQNLLSALAQAAADLKQWQAAFDALIDQALPVLAQLGLRQQSSELEKQLRQLANLQQDWQHRQAQLKSLETAYLQSAQPERQQLKLKLLQAYADMLVQLPPLPSQLATPPSA